MGQPIKNNVDYEQRFSKEMSDLLEYINEEYIQTFPVVEIPVEMFFSAAITIDDCMLFKIIDGYLNSISFTKIQEKLSGILQETTITAVKPGRKLEYSKELKNLFVHSIEECDEMGCDLVTSDHVLLALLNTNNGNEYAKVKKIFNEFGLNYHVALDRSKKLHDITNIIKEEPEDSSSVKIEVYGSVEDLKNIDLLTQLGITKDNGTKKEERRKDGIQYCINLNEQAKNGEIDDLIGRDSEIEKIVKILNRRKSNNVLLIGETGCGKTAIVEGLAKRIVNGTAPVSMSNQVILKFNSNELMSGTQFRGMLEDRMNTIFKELKKREDTILFIDDFHKFFSEKKDDDYNLSAMLLPFLQNTSCKVIATTTYKGFKDTLEKNPDVETKFKRIDILEPTDAECKNILSQIKSGYEKYHNVKFSNEIIDLIIKLAKKYASNRSVLSFTIDILDEIGSKKKQSVIETDEIKEKRNELINSNGDEKVKLELVKLMNTVKDSNAIEVTDVDVYNEIAEYTNIPVSKVSKTDKETINNIGNTLKKYIVGQDEAIELVSRAIKRNKVGLSSKTKPLATFMCIGKTGTGKTLLAKTLAKEIYGSDKMLVRFDMSEYADKTSLNKLIGSSAGYVGYNEGGLLTEAIKSKKHCVLLFDEIEKADEQIYNLFLQVFDDGFLTDNTGQKVDFRNTIIILTSNVGTKMASETRSFGFGRDDSNTQKDVIEKELKKKFPPEFINRLDNIVYFNSLSDENLKQIIKLEIGKLAERIKEINYTLDKNYSNDVIEYLFKKIDSEKEYGARPIIRVIQNEIENQITDLLLSKDYENEYEFKIFYDSENDKLSIV